MLTSSVKKIAVFVSIGVSLADVYNFYIYSLILTYILWRFFLFYFTSIDKKSI